MKFDAESLLEMTLADLVPVLEEKSRVGGCLLCERCNGKCEKQARELLGPRAQALAERWRHADVAAELAGMIDHTLLKPEATSAQIDALCQEACTHHFFSVCVNPRYVLRCAETLKDRGPLVCAVAGFPLGATTAAAKVYEAREAVREGAREVDMVISIGSLRAGANDEVYQEIAEVVRACTAGGAICKVIIEAALLSDEEKVRACRLSVEAGAGFVKTSTGFAKGGATLYDVVLMRHTVGEGTGVKAAGGIRTLADAVKMVVVGATRLGASAGVAIVDEARRGM